MVAAAASLARLEQARTTEEAARVDVLGRAILTERLTSAQVADDPILGPHHAARLRTWFAGKHAVVTEAARLEALTSNGADLAERLQKLANEPTAATPPN
ncbi:MAG: hypothetical protein IPL40_07775 [Proteobacteria bacterium]|nr:hypothetical protein [Pseudomonadota bacterium]